MGNRWSSHKTSTPSAGQKDKENKDKEKDKENKEKEKDKEKTGRARGWSISSLRRGRRGSVRRMSWVPRPHMDCAAWLGALELPQYAANFQAFSGVEDFLYCDEATVLRLGVTCPSHRVRIMNSLRALRDKYEKNHKLKGVDVKPRISLVDDRDHSPDFISVIHTPLPPTPTQQPSTPPHPHKDRVCNSSIYSPVRKQKPPGSGNNSANNTFSNSFKKSSISSDSLLNSNSGASPFSNSQPFTSVSQNLPNRHSNLSITNRHNSISSEADRSRKSFSSNPNILSDSSPGQPNNSPISPTSPTSPSFTPRTNNHPHIHIPALPSRNNSIHGSSSFHSHHNSSGTPLSPTQNSNNNSCHTDHNHSHIQNNIHNNIHNSHTTHNIHNHLHLHLNNTTLSPFPLGESKQHFTKSYSTRSPGSRGDWESSHQTRTGTPTGSLARTISSEGYSSPRSPITSTPEESEDVVLRSNPSVQRRDQRKRVAGLLSPSSMAKMSFNFDSGTSFETADPEDLGHLLEWELSLDSSDLRSHAWYHGNIPRSRAEEIVVQDGAFLVRDCTTQPGNYVLTCHWEKKLLHFVIQKTVVQPDTVYERIQYELEDDSYDTIPDLICAYVGNKRVVTKATRAKILAPVNRSKPLSYYESLYKVEASSIEGSGQQQQFGGSSVPAKPPVTRTYDNRQPPTAAVAPMASVGCTYVRSTTADIQQQQQQQHRPSLDGNIRPTTMESQHQQHRHRPSLEGSVADERSSSSDGIISHKQKTDLTASTQSLPRRIPGGKTDLSLPPTSTSSSTTSTMPVGMGMQSDGPPKPSRVPSFRVKTRKPVLHITDRIYAEIDEYAEQETAPKRRVPPLPPANSHRGASPGGASTASYSDQSTTLTRLSEVYQPSGSDSGNGSGDSIQTTASDARNRDSQGSLVDEGCTAPLEDESLAEDVPPFTMADMDPPSCYSIDTFSTFLLPHAENPPLDPTALNGVRNTIMETGSRIIASHLTYSDLEVLNGLPAQDFGLGVHMGIEMITLPQGSQLRKDLIERTECMRLLVAVTVLKAEDIRMRAELIHKWIQIAIDTKTATGNLYGFNNIMLGLCNPQIQRLTATWHMVRQKFTDSAFSFESKLRSTLKAMNECNNPQAPNTIIPHILPFVMLCERDLEDIYTLRRKDESLLQWESTTSDYGLQMLLLHLQEGRTFAQNLLTYSRNADIILEDPENLEDLILDVFRTEFHLKFLFGSRGALRDSHERHTKFQQILSALSAHCESAVESSV